MLGFSAILAILTCGPPADAAAIEREVAVCQQACATPPGRSDTDRASCRLQCDSKRRAHQIRSEGIRHETSGARPVSRPGPVASPPPPQSTTPGGYTTIIEKTKSSAEIASCQIGCDQAGLASTDRATCKLNCAATTRIVHVVPVSGPAPVPGANPAVVHRPTGDPGAAAPCERECAARIDLSETDRATCKLGCKRHTSVVVEQWTTPPPTAPAQCMDACACESRCLGHEQGCARSCAGKTGGGAATCRLQCEATFSSCSNACKATDCACR